MHDLGHVEDPFTLEGAQRTEVSETEIHEAIADMGLTLEEKNYLINRFLDDGEYDSTQIFKHIEELKNKNFPEHIIKQLIDTNHQRIQEIETFALDNAIEIENRPIREVPPSQEYVIPYVDPQELLEGLKALNNNEEIKNLINLKEKAKKVLHITNIQSSPAIIMS